MLAKVERDKQRSAEFNAANESEEQIRRTKCLNVEALFYHTARMICSRYASPPRQARRGLRNGTI